MMGLDERVFWLLLGCVIGYALRMLQDIRKGVRDVDEVVTRNDKGEGGFVRMPLVLDAMLIILFVLTVYSVFRVEDSVNKAEQAVADIQAQQMKDEAQNKQISRVASCTLEFTAKTIKALNERTTYTTEQVSANVDVLESQLRFLEIVLVLPPVGPDIRRKALEAYVKNVDDFVNVADKAKEKTRKHSYPTNEELSTCLGTVATLEKEKQNERREHGND